MKRFVVNVERECKEYSGEYREGSTVENSTEKAVQWRIGQRRQYSRVKYREGSTVDKSTEKAVQWIKVQRRQYSTVKFGKFEVNW